MPRIYTKTGDDGTTGLIGGKRLFKDSTRIEAYGTVDELNAILGVVRSFSLPERIERILGRVQNDLFKAGADLALPETEDRSRRGITPITDSDILALEKEIDECDAELEPLSRFIIPGGSEAAAMLHLARAVGRRAERRCVALSRSEQMDMRIVRYLNRLSDLCFVLARFLNRTASRPETHPMFGNPEEDKPSS